VKNAKIAELKNNLSRYLDYVKAGGDNARLARLERRGVIRRGAGGLPDWLERRRPPRLRGSVRRDVLTERESGW
jgi:antitoxin (DNA-binding transcriptional repressor) of toxin-antitoxin stability system